MKTLKCCEIETGMKVLLTNPDASYTIDAHNPVIGTKWECCGSTYGCGKNSVSVHWDNGYSNSYKDNELSISYEGRYKSIW